MKIKILLAALIAGHFFSVTYAKELKQIHSVLLVVAMDKEAEPIIKKFNLHACAKNFSPLAIRCSEGKYENIKINLIQNGIDPRFHVANIGTQPAAVSTYIGISNYHPDLVISIGTAGGIQQAGSKAGDTFYSKIINFYDRRIALDRYRAYGIGEYPSAHLSALTKLDIKPGIVCTGDSFDDNANDYQQMLALKCTAIEMEAAGVAWTSMAMHTPMIAIKGITNDVKSANPHEEFAKNFPLVTNKLADQLALLLQNTNN